MPQVWLESDLEAWRKLAGCTECSSGVEIQQIWWRGSVERVTAEMQEDQTQTAAVLRQAFSGLQEPMRRRARSRAA
jgi:hypothetical protein